jgi:hypothetical protein
MATAHLLRRTISSSCARHGGHYETLRVPRNATKYQIKVGPLSNRAVICQSRVFIFPQSSFYQVRLCSPVVRIRGGSDLPKQAQQTMSPRHY